MLLEHLPLRLQESTDTARVEAALETEIVKLWAARDRFEQNLNAGASDMLLEYWERLYGCKMRANGTATVEMIQNVVESFLNGKAEVIERPSDYAFDVKFISVIGVPGNLEILDAALDDVKPAHLAYRYLYRYLLIREVHGLMTLAQLEATTLDKFAGGRDDGE